MIEFIKNTIYSAYDSFYSLLETLQTDINFSLEYIAPILFLILAIVTIIIIGQALWSLSQIIFMLLIVFLFKNIGKIILTASLTLSIKYLLENTTNEFLASLEPNFILISSVIFAIIYSISKILENRSQPDQKPELKVEPEVSDDYETLLALKKMAKENPTPKEEELLQDDVPYDIVELSDLFEEETKPQPKKDEKTKIYEYNKVKDEKTKIYEYNKVKGEEGEKIVRNELSLLGNKYIILNNIILKTASGSTEIDHIVVSVYGLFVIETKNFSVNVIGEEGHKNWLYYDRYDVKKFFDSPLIQNDKHVGVLTKAVNIHKDNVIPIVVFCGTGSINIIASTPVVKINQLNRTIQSYKIPIFTAEKVQQILKKINSCNIYSIENRKKHIEFVEYKKNQNN